MTTLIIDTRNNKKTIVKIKTDAKTCTAYSVVKKPRSDLTLKLIDKLVKKELLDLGSIDKISIEKGPGSYTGVRVGASIANALSFALKVPVNENKLGHYVLPVYE